MFAIKAWWRVALAGLCATVLIAIGLAFPSRTQAASTFSASAGGEIARASVKLVPALLAEEILDPGAVSAQASLTSFGESTAFASTPYPGAVPISLPGLVDGLLASTPGVPPDLAAILNVPDYPLIASSSHPSVPSSNVSLGPVSMDAQSRQREAVATTTDGVNRTEARVVADESTDVVTARATTTVGAIDLGPLVQLAGIRGSATVTQGAGGELERSTEFTVASLSVLGTRLEVTSDGIELAGLKLPLGLDDVLDPVQGLLAALQGRGISVRFVDATETPDGVVSAGLVIESQFDTGINGIVATLTVTLGRTYASVANTARGPLGGDVDMDAGGDTELGSGPTVEPGFETAPGFETGAELPSFGSPGVPASPSGPSVVDRTERISALEPDLTDGGRFYPMIAVGAGVFLVGISLFRTIGVRSAWTS